MKIIDPQYISISSITSIHLSLDLHLHLHVHMHKHRHTSMWHVIALYTIYEFIYISTYKDVNISTYITYIYHWTYTYTCKNLQKLAKTCIHVYIYHAYIHAYMNT